MIVQRHGGASNRGGTRFVGEVHDSTNLTRLIPFVYSTIQTAALEFGNLTVRFIKNGGYITESPKTITGITQANPAVVTSAAHGFSNGDQVYISGVLGMTQIDGRTFRVAGVTTNTFQLQDLTATAINSTGFGAYTSGGTASRIYTVTTPYAAADLALIQYTQIGSTVTLVHQGYAPRELTRTSDTSWALSTITFGPTVAQPTSLPTVTGLTTGGAVTQLCQYAVTTIDPVTGEESAPVLSTAYNTPSNINGPGTITWTNAAGQTANIYRSLGGIFGLIGSSANEAIIDGGIAPNFAAQPPLSRQAWPNGENPGAVGACQQRRIFGNSPSYPQTMWTTRTGLVRNMNFTFPANDTDPIFMQIIGKQVAEIRHFVDLGALLCLTSGIEYEIGGSGASILTPSTAHPDQHSANGSSWLRPLEMASNILYVQARGSIIRDLAFDFEVDGYRGNDITVMSAHLFEGFTIVDWAYQQIPNSLVWAVRSDGVLLSCTYIKEQQMLAWHHHDFSGGTVESVCVVPEGTMDAVYVVVNRTIGGVTKRYVERMTSNVIADIRTAVFMDASLQYDGRNLQGNGISFVLSGGTQWLYTETLTLSLATGSYTFSPQMVGDQIQLTGVDGQTIRFTITAYAGVHSVTGTANRTVPLSLQGIPTLNWAHAVATVSGLSHLEGQAVSVLGDGFVIANPNNPNLATYTVTNGSLTLDRPYAVIQVGLPMTAELETLDIDMAQGEGLVDKAKLVTAVTAKLLNSRGLWTGAEKPATGLDSDFTGLTEYKAREWEPYDSPVNLLTDIAETNIQGTWNTNGRVYLRQTDPLPLTVLSISPEGLFPVEGR